MSLIACSDAPSSETLRGLRLGTVSYLNTAPLNYGIESHLHSAPPAELARRMAHGELDGAVLSVTEVFDQPNLSILDGVAIACDGPVYSVYLASRGALEDGATIYCDVASRTSVRLLELMLAERGVDVILRPSSSWTGAALPDHFLLIGNPAIEQRRAGLPHHNVLDLGAEWKRLTGLPFVFAVWALRSERFTASALECLREAKRVGVAAIPSIVASRPEFDAEFRARYLGGHIRYDLGPLEKEAIALFAEKRAERFGDARPSYRYL